MPALAQAIAIPPPIVPLPTIAAVRTGWNGGGAAVGELRGFAFREEDVQARLGLLGAQQLHEALALARSLGERKRRRVGDAVDRALFGKAAALLGLRMPAGRGDGRRRHRGRCRRAWPSGLTGGAREDQT